MVGVNAHHSFKIHYLSGAMLIQNNGKDSLLYTYTDNQGSLIALTDASGNVVRKYAYDPWGARRNASDWAQKDNGSNLIINRGYTGHEHLDAFGIINMNGRVYDPATASFMSPDPFIQSPGDWVNYNRYSYCMGNPMRYTDPSGYENLGSDNGAADYQKNQFAQWAKAWNNYYIMQAAIKQSIKDMTNCYVTGPPMGYQLPSDSQGEKDMYGRDMYDNMGMYIPQYAQPGGAIPANFGNPAYGNWEVTKSVYQYNSSVKDNESSCGWSPVVVDVVRYRSNFIWDQTLGGGGGAGGGGRLPDFYSLNITIAIPNPITATI